MQSSTPGFATASPNGVRTARSARRRPRFVQHRRPVHRPAPPGRGRWPDRALLPAHGSCWPTWLAPQDPTRPRFELPSSRPGAQFLLGADNNGRDILSRIIYGARISLFISVAAVAVGRPGGRHPGPARRLVSPPEYADHAHHGRPALLPRHHRRPDHHRHPRQWLAQPDHRHRRLPGAAVRAHGPEPDALGPGERLRRGGIATGVPASASSAATSCRTSSRR